MKIYLLPGLGFDHQIFSKLQLKESNVQYINWIEPLKNEDIKMYSKRLAQDIISNDSEKIVLIGHSLGGIVSQEIACFKKIDKIILISSIKSRDEMPFQFRIIQPLFLHKLFTKSWTVSTVRFWGKQHDYETKEEQELFKDMVGKQSNQYLQWALKALSIWKHPTVPDETSVIQINGDSDKTFPIKLINTPHHVIKNGGHFMIYKHAEALSKIINDELKLKNVP